MVLNFTQLLSSKQLMFQFDFVPDSDICHNIYIYIYEYSSVNMKNGVLWDVTPCPHVLEELSASIIKVTRIGELGMLAVCVSC
jgi:hypothetical protein